MSQTWGYKNFKPQHFGFYLWSYLKNIKESLAEFYLSLFVNVSEDTTDLVKRYLIEFGSAWMLHCRYCY